MVVFVANIWLLLADTILVLHALVVLFNLGAVPIIWLGYFRDWKLVRNLYLRIGHLLLISVVVFETLFGLDCPLTTLEDALRLKAGANLLYPTGYLTHWLQSLLFYDVSNQALLVGYGLFFALVLFTFVWVKPGSDSLKVTVSVRPQ